MDELGDFECFKVAGSNSGVFGAATEAYTAQLAPQRARRLDLQGLGGRQEVPRPQFLKKTDEEYGELMPSRGNARGRKQKSAGGETRLNPPGKARAHLGFRRGSAWDRSSDEEEDDGSFEVELQDAADEFELAKIELERVMDLASKLKVDKEEAVEGSNTSEETKKAYYNQASYLFEDLPLSTEDFVKTYKRLRWIEKEVIRRNKADELNLVKRLIHQGFNYVNYLAPTKSMKAWLREEAMKGEVRVASRILSRHSERYLGAPIHSTNVKLAPIKELIFTNRKDDGSPSFQEWIDWFVNTIHNNATISKYEKSMRLRQDIGPDVEKEIQKIPRTAENYERTLQRLIEIYGNEKALVRIEYNKLKKLYNVHTLDGLYKFRSEVENILDQLTLYKEAVDTPSILNDLESKINNYWLDKIKADHEKFTMKQKIEDMEKTTKEKESERPEIPGGSSRVLDQNSLNKKVGIPERKRKLYEEWCVGALREAMFGVLKEHEYEMSIRPDEFKPVGGHRDPQEKPDVQRQTRQWEQKPGQGQNSQKPGRSYSDTPGAGERSYGQNNPRRSGNQKHRWQQPLEQGNNSSLFQRSGPSMPLRRWERRPQQTMAVLEKKSQFWDGKFDRKLNKPNEYRPKQAEKQNERTLFVCVFCKCNHNSAKCPNNVTKAERIQQLKKQGRCTRCVKKGHEEAKCRVTLRACTACRNELHHQALCPKIIEDVKNEQQTNFLQEREYEELEADTSHSEQETQEVYIAPEDIESAMMVTYDGNEEYYSRQEYSGDQGEEYDEDSGDHNYPEPDQYSDQGDEEQQNEYPEQYYDDYQDQGHDQNPEDDNHVYDDQGYDEYEEAEWEDLGEPQYMEEDGNPLWIDEGGNLFDSDGHIVVYYAHPEDSQYSDEC